MNEPISDEDRALIAYMAASGVPNVVTCTVNHSTNTTAGFPSRHRQPGTNGLGLAVDFAGPHGGSDTAEHLAIFHELEKQAHALYELIYTPAGYAYKRGMKVPPYAAADHHNHVHASVDKGVLLVRPAPQGVKPMFDPPFVLEPIVASLKDPATGGTLLLGQFGGTYAFEGARSNGSATGKAYFAGRHAARLEVRQGAAGTEEDPWYRIIDTTGAKYGDGGFQ